MTTKEMEQDNVHVAPESTIPRECTPPASPYGKQKMAAHDSSASRRKHARCLVDGGSPPPPPLGSPYTMSPPGRPRLGSLGSPYRAVPFLVPQSPLSAPMAQYGNHHARILGALPHFNPSMPHPPRVSQIQKAMEAAIVIERKRIKELEAQEENMTADQLRVSLRSERHRMAQMAAELAKHKMTTAHSELEAEMVEEGRVNGLIRRLEELHMEKGQMINELEQEEEMVINTLLHRLDHVRQEKEQLEKVIQDKNDRRHYEAKVTNRPTSLNEEETKVA